MTEPENLTLVLLRELRQDINTQFQHVNSRLDRIDQRLGGVEKIAIGESVLGRYAAARVEDRLDVIERKIAELEGRG